LSVALRSGPLPSSLASLFPSQVTEKKKKFFCEGIAGDQWSRYPVGGRVQAAHKAPLEKTGRP